MIDGCDITIIKLDIKLDLNLIQNIYLDYTNI